MSDDTTNTDDLDGDGTPMGQAEATVRLPFASQHHTALAVGDKTATLRVDHSQFAEPGRTVECVATEDGSLVVVGEITATFKCRAYQARRLLEQCDGAKHSCLDTDTPINEILAPYYTEDVTPGTVVQGIVWERLGFGDDGP